MKYLSLILGKWNQFWFKPIDLFPAALFRITFATVIFLQYALRQFNVLEYYSDRGVVPLAEATELLPEIFRPAFFWFPASDPGIIAFHAIYLILILLLGLGFYSRIVSVFALIIQVAFLHRNYSVAYGADIMACYWLLSLCFIESDRVLSLRSKLKLPSFAPKFPDLSLSTMGVRFIQIQLCVIYGYTGLEKLKGSVWWEGTAVWQVMSNQQLSTLDLSFLQNFPLLVVLMTYSTLIFEIYFPFAVWNSKTRPWWLTIGFFFHVGIALTMGLIFFSGVMLAAYLVFLNGDALRQRLNLPRSRE